MPIELSTSERGLSKAFLDLLRMRSPQAAAAPTASWVDSLDRDRTILRAQPAGLPDLAAAAPRLVDTIDREQLAEALRGLKTEEVAGRSGLAFAAGYLALQQGAVDDAIAWFSRAQSALRPDEGALAARIAFELGAVFIARSCKVPADVLLLDHERRANGEFADVLHLRALVAESMGDHMQAIALYRQALGSDLEALSPTTRVLAMINLAASSHQRDPAESLALAELALAVIGAHELHPQFRPPALNIMGYALICLGRLDEARETLESAAHEAIIHGHPRVQLYALFNQAIVHELQGSVGSAEAGLREVATAAAARFPELAGWARIRLIWLAWLTNDVGEAAQMLAEHRDTLRSMRYAESISCLEALLEASAGRPSEAIARLESARRAAALRGDATTEFAFLLRLADLESTLGDEKRGARHAKRALALFETCTFRLSPNWWSREIFESFVRLAGRPIAHALVAPLSGHPLDAQQRPTVVLRMDGTAAVGSHEVGLNWRSGRTGSRVLMRLFRLLLVTYPQPLKRDILSDRLWPESEGDAAIQNLYAAANDLRKVLVDLPGVRLDVSNGDYSLRLSETVTLTPVPLPTR
jgi:tetratricopeptide (TPR) repeat protein